MPAFSRFLRYFAVVGRAGSIRRAAEQLNVSASAIDRQLLAAEAELGAALFERLPTGLRLTSAGELLMGAAGQWQKGLNDVRAHIEDLRGLRRGHVDVAVIDALAEGALPKLVARVQAEYPGITIGLHVLENDDVAEAVRSGTADLGLLLDPRFSRDFSIRAHAEVAVGFAAPPGHPLVAGPSRRLSDAVGHRLVLPEAPLALAGQVEALCRLGGVTVHAAVRCDNIRMMKSLAMEGVGAAVLTSLDVLHEVGTGTLAFTPIAEPLLRPLTLALCVNSPRQLSTAATLMLDQVEGLFPALAWAPRPEEG